GNWGGIRKMVKDAIHKGELPFELGIHPEFGSPRVYAEDLVYDDEVNVWSGNLLGMSGLNRAPRFGVISGQRCQHAAPWQRRALHAPGMPSRATCRRAVAGPVRARASPAQPMGGGSEGGRSPPPR
ncbi:MAG: hypothetical protein ACE5JU_15515, partial [Candidatus Binatia bacterium]